MAVRIRLSDGSAFVVGADFHELRNKVMSVLAEDGETLIEVRNGDGRMRSINPRQIAYLEEAEDGDLTPREEQILEAAREREEHPPAPAQDLQPTG